MGQLKDFLIQIRIYSVTLWIRRFSFSCFHCLYYASLQSIYFICLLRISLRNISEICKQTELITQQNMGNELEFFLTFPVSILMNPRSLSSYINCLSCPCWQWFVCLVVTISRGELDRHNLYTHSIASTWHYHPMISPLYKVRGCSWIMSST